MPLLRPALGLGRALAAPGACRLCGARARSYATTATERFEAKEAARRADTRASLAPPDAGGLTGNTVVVGFLVAATVLAAGYNVELLRQRKESNALLRERMQELDGTAPPPQPPSGQSDADAKAAEEAAARQAAAMQAALAAAEAEAREAEAKKRRQFEERKAKWKAKQAAMRKQEKEGGAGGGGGGGGSGFQLGGDPDNDRPPPAAAEAATS